MDLPMQATPTPPSVLQRTVGEGLIERELLLLFMGCEAKPPYGPYEHTATLFLDILTRALSAAKAPTTNLVLHVYRVSQGHFPPIDSYAKYSGVILPGSFNSAYDHEPWISELSKIVQEELVAKKRPTLGVCFGHQIYAHSFPDGEVIRCPAGPQAGRKVSKITEHGKQWLQGTSIGSSSTTKESGLHLFYSHGDMVDKLPGQGLALGGNKQVPIQAAIYFCPDDKLNPIAVTLQAHPEYASSRGRGLEKTLHQVLMTMRERGEVSKQDCDQAEMDAIAEFENVEKQSIETIVRVSRLLGWLP